MERNNIIVIFGIGMFMMLAFGLILFTIPISNDTKDVTINVVVHQPLIGNIEIKDATATEHPHTILSLGSLFNFLKDVSDGDKYTVVASAGGITTQKEFQPLTRTYDAETTLKLKNVNNYDSTVQLQIVQNGKIVDEEIITIQ